MADSDGSTSTIPSDDGSDGWERSLRIVSVGLIGVFVLLSSSGLLGVRTRVASRSSGGYTVEVTHAATTRPGLATPFDVAVATDDGSPLPRAVTVRVDSKYLAMFDDNGMEPLPVTSFNTPDLTSWTFEVPPGSPRLKVALDARLEPAVQWGRQGTVLVDVGEFEMPDVRFNTWVMP